MSVLETADFFVHTLVSMFWSLGEADKPCVLKLTDDSIHEEEEELRLVLGNAKSDSPYGASIGNRNEMLIKINDNTDSKKEAKTFFITAVFI